MNVSEYMDIFITESKENLLEMNKTLLELEKDSKNLKYLDNIFRVAHTLKGMSGTMQFDKMQRLTHEMENMLDLIRSGVIKPSPSIIDVLFECLDALEHHVTSLEELGVESNTDRAGLIKKIKTIVTGDIQDVDNGISESNTVLDFDISDIDISSILSRGNNLVSLKVSLKKDCMLKGARAFIVLSNLESECKILRIEPPLKEIEIDNFGSSFNVLLESHLSKDSLEDLTKVSSDIENVIVNILTAENKTETVSEVLTLNDAIEKMGVEVQDNSKQRKQNKSVRVDISRLDNLMNLVSELIIIKTSMTDNESADSLNNSIEYLERITTNLHDAVMKVRMVAVESVFNRFPRMVRDLSKELNKKINLIMSGEETEVDRTVIDELSDPLIHLIRNSLDHGIEKTEDRIKKGKSEEGTVNLRAYPEGNSVIIEVEDDGNGIDPEKVKKRVLDKGLMSAMELDSLKEKEIYNLLFLPGFSTAEVVTDLSGRGVGLDVVKSKIGLLGGSVDVESELGKGSKFIIRLPLTLAILQALLVYVGTEKYALPLNNISEITNINSSEITNIQDSEVVLFRNKTLPLIRLADVLGSSDVEYSDELIVVIIKKGNIELGLIVTGLIGQQEIVIKSLGQYLKTMNIISGATILGNGEVAMIIDPTQLV